MPKAKISSSLVTGLLEVIISSEKVVERFEKKFLHFLVALMASIEFRISPGAPGTPQMKCSLFNSNSTYHIDLVAAAFGD